MNCKVLCIGEVLWDIIRGTEHIGGAPFNLAAHLARLDFYPPDILRQSLGFSTVVKLNADEAPLVAQRLYGGTLSEAELATQLARDFPVRVLCVIKGADGCTVYSGDVARSYACEPVRVADTVGAGDAFSAAFLEHYCRTGDPFTSAQRGNLLGAYVASQPGAVPEYSETIRQRLAI